MHTGLPWSSQCQGSMVVLPSFSLSFPQTVTASITRPQLQQSRASGSVCNSTFRPTARNNGFGANDSSCGVARVGTSINRESDSHRARGCGTHGKGSSALATLQESVITVVENGIGNGALVEEVEERSEDYPNSYIGYGGLLESGSLFRERFVIRFSESGPRGTITLETLSSLLQEAATNHVIAMDYAFTPGKNFEGIITVITRMHIEVDRYPAWRDLLEIDTWFQPEGKNSVRRDWIVKDVKSGKHIAFATSTWVLMNTKTRRLTKITPDKWAELEPHMRYPPTWALSEERRNASSTKIVKLDDDAKFKIPTLIATQKDCDMNQHVNNIRYMCWMLESIPEEIKGSFEVSKITLEYRQEASQGEVVESLAEPEDMVSSDTRQFTHLLKTSEVGKEINRGRTVWRPLQ